jgi:hypothetical protein
MKHGILLVLISNLALLACQRSTPNEPQVSAEFGVYFGGQIQQRRDIPFELDGTKQTHGFRVTFADPPAEAHEIAWQVSPPRFSKPPSKKPSAAAGAPSDEPSREVSGSALLQAGQRQLAQAWTFKPGDPLGVWNIRVTLDRRVLIDRPFLVYDTRAREQQNRSLDAGR